MASVLNDGDRLGPILVQLPPDFKRDGPLPDKFLALRPRTAAFAFEPRHPSWYTEETYVLLRRHETALCLAETQERTPADILTAGFTYVQLRRENYTSRQLSAWRKRMNAWMKQDVAVYVYCKHEDEGKAPEHARQILGKGKCRPPSRANRVSCL